jgi:hypothetical protein
LQVFRPIATIIYASLAGDATGRISEDSWVESVLYDEGDATDLAFLAADLATDDREYAPATARRSEY